MQKVRPATGQPLPAYDRTIAFASVRAKTGGTWPAPRAINQRARTRSLCLFKLSKERRDAAEPNKGCAANFSFFFFCFFIFVDSFSVARLQLQLQLICIRHRTELWMRFRRGLQLKIGTRTKGVCAASVCVCGVLCKSLSRQTFSR